MATCRGATALPWISGVLWGHPAAPGVWGWWGWGCGDGGAGTGSLPCRDPEEDQGCPLCTWWHRVIPGHSRAPCERSALVQGAVQLLQFPPFFCESRGGVLTATARARGNWELKVTKEVWWRNRADGGILNVCWNFLWVHLFA